MVKSNPHRLGEDDPDASPFEQINSICQSFSGECPAPDAQPKTESDHFLQYLQQIGKTAPQELFRNVLQLEVDRRRQVGEPINVEDFLRVAPQFADAVRQVARNVVRQSTAASKAVSTQQPPPKSPDQQSPAQSVAYAPPMTKTLGEFEIVRKLGEGGMGEVYLARHRSRGDQVALKKLLTRHQTSQDTLENVARLREFKDEFRSLADINHRHLVGLHTLEEDRGQYFFTMDLIDGDGFLSYVRPGEKLNEQRLRKALSQLVAGVMALHHHNIVHRDLKPNNVMVDRQGQVKILDFGLVVNLAQNVGAATTVHFHGTPAYAAPEQALGQQTFASDWYAVGVMLHEALVGRWPFRGGLPMQLLKQKQERDAESIVGQPNVPDDLAKLCMRLLSRDSQKRPEATEIAQIVSAEVTLSKPVAETEHPLIGRDEQLAALRDAHQFLVEQQQPLNVFVSGRSGEGKSYLIERFLQPLWMDKSLTILSGRCYDRESVPFKALDRLIDVLSSYLHSLSDADAALMMPDDISFLAHLFPVLKRVDVVARTSTVRVSNLDEQQVRQRAYAALRQLLSRMSRQTPVIMFIDDLQWGDADSAEVMFQVLRPPETPAVLFLGSYRSDEAQGSPFLKAWSDLQRKNDVQLARRDIEVGPLSLEQCVELVIAEVGTDNDVVRRRAVEFFQETGGNPILLHELIGCFDADTDTFRAMPLHEVIDRKLGSLPQDAVRLLEVIAVSGQALSLGEASKAAGHHDAPPIDTITHMRTEKLVRLIGSEESPLVDTYHDKIRETVLEFMEDEPCRTTHLILAETIEGDGGGISDSQIASLESGQRRQGDEPEVIPRVHDLAYHYDAADKTRKAWSYAFLAAEQAKQQFALEVAAERYEMARRNAGESTSAVRFEIAAGHGEALMLAGRYEPAKEALDGAVDLTDDPFKQARIDAVLGELEFKMGSIKPSVAHFESGLRRLGVRVPKTSFGFALAAAQQTLIQMGHSYFPKLFRLHQTATNERLELINQIFSRLSMTYFFHNMVKQFWSHWSGMNRAEKTPPSPQLAYIYAMHSFNMAIVGWNKRSIKYGNRSIEFSRDFHDNLGLAISSSFTGIGNYWLGRYENGLAHLTEAVEQFSKSGDLWETNLAHFHVGCCQYKLGNLIEAIKEARWVYESSIRIGENARAHCASYLWSRAMGGNLPFDEIKNRYRTNEDDILSTFHGVMGQGHWHLFHGRTEEALETFERAYKSVMNNLVINGHTATSLPTMVTALRRHAEAVEDQDPAQSKKLRKRALRRVRWAVWASRLLFKAEYAHSLRELSLLLKAKGRTRKALKIAQKSCDVAQRLNAKCESAESLLVRGELAQKLGLPEAKEQIEAAKKDLAKFDEMIRSAMAEYR